MTVIARYRAVNAEHGPAVICEDDQPGTILAMVGRQQDAEQIADALNNYEGAVEVLERIARGRDGQGAGTLLDSSRRLSRADMMRVARDAIGGQ